MALRGRELRRARGRHRDDPRRQRRRQDDHSQDRLRRHGSAEGQRHARGPRRSRARSGPGDPARARAMCRRAARCSRSSRCARTCAWAPTPASDTDGGGPGSRDGQRVLPGPARAPSSGPGPLSGGEQQMLAIGRALMARPKADAAGRALARPVAQAGQGHLRHHPAHQPGARRDHAPGRAEREHRATDRGLRLRAWSSAAS